MEHADIQVGDVLFYTPHQYVARGRARKTYEVTVIAIRPKRIVVNSLYGVLSPYPKHLSKTPLFDEEGS